MIAIFHKHTPEEVIVMETGLLDLPGGEPTKIVANVITFEM